MASKIVDTYIGAAMSMPILVVSSIVNFWHVRSQAIHPPAEKLVSMTRNILFSVRHFTIGLYRCERVHPSAMGYFRVTWAPLSTAPKLSCFN